MKIRSMLRANLKYLMDKYLGEDTILPTIEGRKFAYKQCRDGSWAHVESILNIEIPSANSPTKKQIVHNQIELVKPDSFDENQTKAKKISSEKVQKFTIQLVSGIFIVLLGCLAFLVKTQLEGQSSAIKNERSIFRLGQNYSPNKEINKQSFLSTVSQKQKREISGQTHFVSYLINTHGKKTTESFNLAVAIVRESLKAGVDPFLVAAIIKAESTFNRNAVSPVGARGLMQVMPDTGAYVIKKQDYLANLNWEGADALADPSYNIRLGIAYLKYLHKKFDGNLERVLVAYNWGPGSLISALRNGRAAPHSTRVYASTILGNYRRWSDQYASNASQFQYLNIG